MHYTVTYDTHNTCIITHLQMIHIINICNNLLKIKKPFFYAAIITLSKINKIIFRLLSCRSPINS